MGNDEFSMLVKAEDEKRTRAVIRGVAHQLDQIKGNELGELTSQISSMLNADEIESAIHQLRLSYEELELNRPDLRNQLA